MTTLRGPDRKSVGKPDAGNRHVRFDERGRETGLLAPRSSSTLPVDLWTDNRLKTGAVGFLSETGESGRSSNIHVSFPDTIGR